MGPPPSTPFTPVLVAVTLLVALAGCGGGTTGAPLAGTTTAPAPVAPSTATTRAAPPAPASRAATAPAAPRASGQGGAPVRTTTPPSVRPAVPAPAKPAARAPRPAAPPPRTVTVDERADLTLTRRASPAHYFQAGTVTGTYSGTMTAEVRITSQGVLVSFTATVPGGTIVGHAVAVAVINGSATPGLRGTGQITGGTGRFAGVHGAGLRVTGSAKPDGSSAHVRLTGSATL